MADDYRVPGPDASESTKLGWCKEAQQTGEQWMKLQRAHPSIAEALDMVLSVPNEQIPEEMSKVRAPLAKRNIMEIVAGMSNLRPTASNKTDNSAYFAQAEILNKLDRAWFYNAFADRDFRGGFQKAAVLGTCYIGHAWDPDFNGRQRRGEIRTDSWGPSEVYLIHPPRDHDLQKCYAVGVKTRTPLHLVQAKYPLRAHQIVPDRGSKAWTQKGLDYVQSFMSSPLRALTHGLGDEVENQEEIWPTCDVIEWTILDLSINMTGHDVEMGEPGRSWHYTVPSFRSQIPTGTNGLDGMPLYRLATGDDALLYPLRRKIVQTSTCLLYDDTAEWWHGKVPLAKFSFDDWFSEALGFPLTRDVAAIETDINQLLRGITDSALIRLAPPMVADENLVSERLAERWNPRSPRQMLRLNLSMGDALKPALPPGYADQPQTINQHVKDLEGLLNKLMGTQDMLAVVKAKQLPSVDSMEKIQEMAGPISQDRTRSMERAMRDLGEQRRYLNFQFRTAKQLLQLVGEHSMVEEVFDYDPGNLIPSHLPDEDPERGPSKYTIAQRARRHADNFYYHVVPHSMARMHQMSQKLILIQLMSKVGFPVDPYTLAEMFEIDNFGPPPEGGDTIVKRWILWQEFILSMQQKFGGAGQQGETRGRKPSGTKAPKLKQKDGGSRSTITQS